VAFRLARVPGEPLPGWNRRNSQLLGAINRRNRVHLSSTMLPTEDGDAFTLRLCVLSFRSHALHVDHGLEDVAASISALIL
jgi:aromatic-L-amino-acid decarboxylase